MSFYDLGDSGGEGVEVCYVETAEFDAVAEVRLQYGLIETSTLGEVAHGSNNEKASFRHINDSE